MEKVLESEAHLYYYQSTNTALFSAFPGNEIQTDIEDIHESDSEE